MGKVEEALGEPFATVEFKGKMQLWLERHGVAAGTGLPHFHTGKVRLGADGFHAVTDEWVLTFKPVEEPKEETDVEPTLVA